MSKRKTAGLCMTLAGFAYLYAFFQFTDAFEKINDTLCMILTLLSIECFIWGVILLLLKSKKQKEKEEAAKQEEERRLAPYLKNKPYCTRILIGINILAFVLINMMQGEEAVLNFALSKNHFAFYRFFTAMFTHAGGAHLLLNMTALFFCGGRLEAIIGNGRYFLVYGLSGLCSSACIAAFSETPCVGASGAIFGLFGCYLLLSYRNREVMKYTYQYDLLPTVLFNLVLSFLIPNVSAVAHIGGLAAGILCYFIVCRKIILK